MGSLPSFVAPMLAKLRRRPFNSELHLFEAKWDGFRAQLSVEDGTLRVRSRRDRDLTAAFPECAVATALPSGTMLDGELVVLRGGRPDFEAMLRRGQAKSENTARRLAATLPASFVAFDLLYDAGESLLELPLSARRERLEARLRQIDSPLLVLSEGATGAGVAFFERFVELGFEGIVAKRLDSPYLSGERSDLWTKVKAEQRRLCVVLGFLRDADGALKSLIVGSDVDGKLRCIGRVGSGLGNADRVALQELLEARLAQEPIVEAGPPEGVWVQPGIFCTVRFLELTSSGTMRAPVFEGLVDPE